MKKIYSLLLTAGIFTVVSHAQWNIQNSVFPNENTGVSCISIANPAVVWAASFDSSYNNPMQDFTMTSNGGATWTAGTVNGINSNFNISTICGINADTAWVSVTDWNNG